MPLKDSRTLMDAELLVKLAYLTICEEEDLKSLETLRLTYKLAENNIPVETGFEASLELTPLEELHRFCEEALKASEDLIKG